MSPTVTKVLVYSHDHGVRDGIRRSLGRRPVPELPEIEYLDVATEPALIAAADKGGIDLFILDGEAVPVGGMGVARQLKDEIYNCPPILLLIARAQDAWLAHWSRADAVAATPVDPFELAGAVARLLRERAALTTG